MSKSQKLHIDHQDHLRHKHSDEAIITIKDFSYSYLGSKGKEQLQNINLSFGSGAWTTIIGPNGSGKSTLAKAMVRLLKSKSGAIKIKGRALKNYRDKEFARLVSYIPQSLEIPGGTFVKDFVAFGRHPHTGLFGTLQQKDKEIIASSLKLVGAKQLEDKLLDQLSGGERQKVLIAMIIAQQSEIIVLDEPTTYLDIRNQYQLLELLDFLHHQGKTIITVLHNINQAVQYSDQVYILSKGAVYSQGKPGAVVTNKMLQDVYGVDTKFQKLGNKKYITDVKLVKK